MSKANEKHIGRRALLKGTALTTIATTLPTLPALAVGGDDHALIEAEAEITRLYAWLDANPDADEELERDPVYERVYPLEDFIALTPARSLAGVAVKLRRMLDREVGIDTGTGVNDVPALLSILAFVHSVVGEPPHPTRPLSTLEDRAEEGEA